MGSDSVNTDIQFFTYDFKIGEVLKSEGNHRINRIFIIYFPTEQQKDNFFSDPDYLKVKEDYFKPSVSETTILASYMTT